MRFSALQILGETKDCLFHSISGQDVSEARARCRMHAPSLQDFAIGICHGGNNRIFCLRDVKEPQHDAATVDNLSYTKFIQALQEDCGFFDSAHILQCEL